MLKLSKVKLSTMHFQLLLLACLLFSVTVVSHAYNAEAAGAANGRNNRLPFLRQQDMVGVWQLRNRKSFLPRLTSKTPDNPSPEYGDDSNIIMDVVLRLDGDGSFHRYGDSSKVPIATRDDKQIDKFDDGDDDLANALERGGTWTYREDEFTLILALDRPKNTDSRRIHDTLLSGKLMATSTKQIVEPMSSQHDDVGSDEASTVSRNLEKQAVDGHASLSKIDSSAVSPGQSNDSNNDKTSDLSSYDFHLSIPEGQVAVGKFMYPKKHMEFFEDPMLFRKSVVGTFSLHQLLGNLNTRLRQEREKRVNDNGSSNERGYHKRDFYGKRFYLTSTPLPVNPEIAKRDKRYDPMKTLHDFRVTPITFHCNNTFTAYGSDKLLRGRFGICSDGGSDDTTGTTRDRLWFQVNLFGAGRSAPGSVYSEGRGISQEDRRGYRGSIQEYPRTTLTNKTDEISRKIPTNEVHDPAGNSSNPVFSSKANQTMLMFVEGNVFYGNDMGMQKRPSVIATFTLQEICDNDEDSSGGDDEDDGEDYDLDVLNINGEDDDDLEGAFQ